MLEGNLREPESAVEEIFKEDQGDRAEPARSWEVLSARDYARRTEVRRLLQIGEVKSGWEHFWAAVVMLHGLESEDYRLALSLVERGMAIAPELLELRPLCAVARDRLQLSLGLPQWYGTQKVVRGGRLQLEPLSEAAVSDEERRAMGVATVEERLREIEILNVGFRRGMVKSPPD